MLSSSCLLTASTGWRSGGARGASRRTVLCAIKPRAPVIMPSAVSHAAMPDPVVKLDATSAALSICSRTVASGSDALKMLVGCTKIELLLHQPMRCYVDDMPCPPTICAHHTRVMTQHLWA